MKFPVPSCLAILISVTLFPATGHASMSGNEIKGLISGKTVNLKTRWGSFPLRYDASGQVTGDGSGMGLAKFYAPRETGRWWVTGDSMCQKFPTWYDGRTFCFKLSKSGATGIDWVRSDGYSGTATVRP